LRGKVYRHADRLYLSSRTTGDLPIVDFADLAHPKLIEHLNVPGNPAKLLTHRDRLVIPNGYEGLWLERDPQ